MQQTESCKYNREKKPKIKLGEKQRMPFIERKDNQEKRFDIFKIHGVCLLVSVSIKALKKRSPKRL